jgi:hypothetical protein
MEAVYSSSEVLSMENICENNSYSHACGNSSRGLKPGGSLPLSADLTSEGNTERKEHFFIVNPMVKLDDNDTERNKKIGGYSSFWQDSNAETR